MIKLSTLSVVCGFALLVAAAHPASASNLAPEVETRPAPHQELMLFLYLPGNHPDTQTAESNPQIAGYAARATSAGKPVFAVGDSSLWLARANLLRGRHATGSRALQPFLVWSGVEVQDEPVVRDDLIYTSRDAFDLPKLMAVVTQLLTVQ
jgi:putative intracellular protease/amidase